MQISKPDVNQVWASAGEVLKPTDSKIQQGWEAEIPPRQYFNYIDNRQDQFNAHVNQMGIPLWDIVTEYQINTSKVQGSDGRIYVAKVTHTGHNPTTDYNNDYWKIAWYSADEVYSKSEADGLGSGVSITGPTTVSLNSTNTYTITDFDSFSNYSVSVDRGSVTRTNDTFVLTIPATGVSGAVNLTVTRDAKSSSYQIPISQSSQPNMTNFTTTVPNNVTQNSTYNVAFSGATDPNGGAVTYSIDPQSSGLSFSKTSNIANGESVVMTVPSSVDISRSVSFLVRAMTASGGSVSRTISTNIVGQPVNEYTNPGTFTYQAPITGNYEIIVVGGGGGGGGKAFSGSGTTGAPGGGSGYAQRLVRQLTSGVDYGFVVGAGGQGGAISSDATTAKGKTGGTTSFSTFVSATGGEGGLAAGPNASWKGGNGGSGGGGAGLRNAEGTSSGNAGAGGANGTNGVDAYTIGGTGQGANYYSNLDSTVTHASAGLPNSSFGGGGGGSGWGNAVAPSTTAGGGYGAGGAGATNNNVGYDGRAGYIRIKYLGA